MVSGPLPPPLGGIAAYCQDFLGTNLPSEFDITFCRSTLIKSVFTTKGVIRFVLRCFVSFVTMVVWIWQLICKQPNIAHVHTNSYKGFYEKAVFALFARMLGAGTVLHIHGGGFKDFYTNTSGTMRKIIRLLLNANSRVIVLSEQSRSFFESIGIHSRRIVVLSNCVFMPNISLRNKNADQIVILFMSRLEKNKGIHELIDVIKRRNQKLSNCKYVLAGPRTSEWTELSNRIDNAAPASNIEVPGPLVGKEKEYAYQNADIYVLQSYVEGMPIGLLEAMSYGLVCITTPVGGIPSVVQNMHNGILIEPGNAHDLQNALELLVADPELRDKIGRQARETVNRHYNWDKRADQINKFYLDIVSEHTR